jgi:hypothetical protein
MVRLANLDGSRLPKCACGGSPEWFASFAEPHVHGAHPSRGLAVTQLFPSHLLTETLSYYLSGLALVAYRSLAHFIYLLVLRLCNPCNTGQPFFATEALSLLSRFGLDPLLIGRGSLFTAWLFVSRKRSSSKNLRHFCLACSTLSTVLSFSLAQPVLPSHISGCPSKMTTPLTA